MLLWLQERVRDCLAQAAMTDALTGALNRHGALPMLERELARAARSGRPVWVVLCDLDHFKQVNDRHGHHVGDLVLGGFVNRARALLRKGDVLALADCRLYIAKATRDRIVACDATAAGTVLTRADPLLIPASERLDSRQSSSAPVSTPTRASASPLMTAASATRRGAAFLAGTG